MKHFDYFTAAFSVLLIFQATSLLAQSSVYDASINRQASQTSGNTRNDFVIIEDPLLALVNVRVIDGTGAAARDSQTVVIRNGKILQVGNALTVKIPGDTRIIDLKGKTVIPGLIMLHEHLFYPAKLPNYIEHDVTFPRLYLAGGVTTIRTAGGIDVDSDLKVKKQIDNGLVTGPKIDVTAPFINGPGYANVGSQDLYGAEDTRRMVADWSERGATSFKVYDHVTREQLRAVIDEAHRHGHRVTGHLGSITYREAAQVGIDNIEHSFWTCPDFVPGKQPDQCPTDTEIRRSLRDLDVNSPEATALITELVQQGITLTATPAVYETLTPRRPMLTDEMLEYLTPELQIIYLKIRVIIADRDKSIMTDVFKKVMLLEKAFVEAGGLLAAGTDPTGYGGVIPGFANQRTVELLVEAGFTPEQAIQICTANGAKYLGRLDQVGTIEAGKEADLVVLNGNLVDNIQDIRKVEIVFKDGVGYDSKKLFASARGQIGIR